MKKNRFLLEVLTFGKNFESYLQNQLFLW